MDIQTVIERVNKLFALADGGANPNESANAAYQAQKLLEKYKLTRASVEAVSSECKEEDIIEDSSPLEKVKNSTLWRDLLAKNVATCNGCKVYWHHGGGFKYLKIVGRQSDIELVRWLYASITNQIDAMCKSAMVLGFGHGKRWSNSFKQGASSTVIERLLAARSDVRAEYVNTAALVLVERREADLKRWVEYKLPNLTPGKQRSFSISPTAYDHGLKAGERVDLSRGKLERGIRGLLK